MATSKRSRRSRAASATSSSRRRGAAAPGRDDHLVEMRVAVKDRSGGRLDEIGEVRVGIAAGAARG